MRRTLRLILASWPASPRHRPRRRGADRDREPEALAAARPSRPWTAQETALEAFAGKVVVLNLWATWCAPCREEMPSLDRLQAQFADRDVVVLALSVDRAGPERVQQFLDEIGVKQLHVYRDPKAAATRAVKVPGPARHHPGRPPGARGRPRAGHRCQWDGPAAVAAVEQLLAEPAG